VVTSNPRWRSWGTSSYSWSRWLAATLELELPEVQLEVGVGSQQGAERDRDEPRAGGLEGADVHGAGDGPSGLLHGRLGPGGGREHRVGLGDQGPARRRQHDPPALLLHQGGTEVTFEGRDPLGDRRGRVGERLGGRRHRPAGGDLAQELESVEVERHRSACLHRSVWLKGTSTNVRWT
jgi:hypothetical protein